MKIKEQLFSDRLLSISIGLVYLWFGGLKFFPHFSPAETLATNTIDALTFGIISENISIVLLAIWETVIGLLLILNILKKQAIVFALIHMAFTFTPLFLLPDQSFTGLPMGLTLVGQYIFKNIIIVSALIALYKIQLNKKLVNK